MVVVRTLKDVLTVQFKPRHDSYSDQFNRLLMTKMLLISSIIMGVDYFSDQVNCMVPKNAKHSKEFFHAACWITGFYIFDEMQYRLDESGYFGIPSRVDHDGIHRITNKLCHTKDLFKRENEDCEPMTRLYYLHYQWMPVYMAALGIFFYLPYVLFRIANTDLITLKKEIKKSSNDTTPIIKNYFNYSVNSISQMRIRIWWNLIVKILYLLFGLSAFYITDHLLLGRYVSYGVNYLRWYGQNNTLRHISVSKSSRANAGNVLLPSMGYCDIHEASLEVRATFHNENRFICEISPHILYQYVLMVVWFFFIGSIIISILGLFFYISNHIFHMVPFRRNSSKQKILNTLTLREIEYLDIIKKRNMVKYGDILRRLKDQRLSTNDKSEEGIALTEDLDKYISSFEV